MNVTVTLTITGSQTSFGAINDIYLLVAYLAIGLLSVAVPTYAIGVSYVSREKWRLDSAIEELCVRDAVLDAELKRAQTAHDKSRLRLLLNDLDQELKKTQELKKQLRAKGFLSVRGTVGYPFVGFLAAVIVVALFGYYTGESQLALGLFTASIFMAFGTFHIVRSLRTIEQAAVSMTGSLLPSLRINFGSGTKSMNFKAGEQAKVSISISNHAHAEAENVCIGLIFTREFTILPGNTYKIRELEPTDLYPNSIEVRLERERIEAYIDEETDVFVKMPDKPGIYSIFVEIREKKIGRMTSALVFEVSDRDHVQGRAAES